MTRTGRSSSRMHCMKRRVPRYVGHSGVSHIDPPDAWCYHFGSSHSCCRKVGSLDSNTTKDGKSEKWTLPVRTSYMNAPLGNIHREHPFITFAKFPGFWTPSLPFVRISRNLSVLSFAKLVISLTPPPPLGANVINGLPLTWRLKRTGFFLPLLFFLNDDWTWTSSTHHSSIYIHIKKTGS